jgi:hypothetical protein
MNTQKYKFFAKGILPDGNKFKCDGTFYGPESDGVPPYVCWEMAADIVEKSPLGIRPNLDKSDIKIQKLKGKK